MLRMIIAGILSVTLTQFAFWDRWLPKKEACPECAGTQTVTINKLVENIETREVGGISMSSDLITITKYTYSCQTCGHKWDDRIKEKI